MGSGKGNEIRDDAAHSSSLALSHILGVITRPGGQMGLVIFCSKTLETLLKSV